MQPEGSAGSAATGGAGTGDASGSAGAAGTGATAGGSAGTNGTVGVGGVSGTAGSAGTAGAAGSAKGGGGGATAGAAGSARGGSTGTAGGAGSDACPGAAYDAASPPKALMLTGNLGAHDPAAYVVGNTVYLAATGLGAKTSTNLTSWSAAANPLPSHNGAWAPDISSFGGMFHLYYAVSSFGSNKSCIGQATRAALDSGSWTDKGNVLCSNMGTNDNWNAIDPNIVVDDAGVPWMDFGSFWSGIKMVKLNTDGTRADTMLYDLASGPGGGAVEGPFIFKRCGYYYLFVSFGSCCSSPYNYTIRVGRSATVTGPYVDKDGYAADEGGGTLLVQGNSSWSAPATTRSSCTTTAPTTSITRSPPPPDRTEPPRCASPRSYGTRTAGRSPAGPRLFDRHRAVRRAPLSASRAATRRRKIRIATSIA